MSTLSNRIFNILRNDMHPGQFELAENKADIAKITLADLDLLASNIPVLKEHVIALQAVAEKEAEENRKNLLKKLEAFAKENGIDDVNALLSTIGADAAKPAKAAKPKPAKDNNTRFIVTLLNPETGKHDSFPVVNKGLSKKLKDHPAYVALIAKDKTMTDVDVFLRAYSPEYQEKYPINAKYKTKTFHINDQGKLNKQSQAFYEDYLKGNPTMNTTEQFRQIVKETYKR